jgi:hypothetical protein
MYCVSKSSWLALAVSFLDEIQRYRSTPAIPSGMMADTGIATTMLFVGMMVPFGWVLSSKPVFYTRHLCRGQPGVETRLPPAQI